MYREYDVFEKFSDGSTLWRASVLGIEGTLRHLQALAQRSENQFHAIDTISGKIVRPDLDRIGFDLLTPRKALRRNKAAVA